MLKPNDNDKRNVVCNYSNLFKFSNKLTVAYMILQIKIYVILEGQQDFLCKSFVMSKKRF